MQRSAGHSSLFAVFSMPVVTVLSLVSSAVWGELLLALTWPGEQHMSAVIGN